MACNLYKFTCETFMKAAAGEDWTTAEYEAEYAAVLRCSRKHGRPRLEVDLSGAAYAGMEEEKKKMKQQQPLSINAAVREMILDGSLRSQTFTYVELDKQLLQRYPEVQGRETGTTIFGGILDRFVEQGLLDLVGRDPKRYRLSGDPSAPAPAATAAAAAAASSRGGSSIAAALMKAKRARQGARSYAGREGHCNVGAAERWIGC